MDPIEGAIVTYNKLSSQYDTYILSTSPWENPSAWEDKILWVKKYLEKSAYQRLILPHHKNLNRGNYLIDDRLKNGTDKFPDWKSVLSYLS